MNSKLVEIRDLIDRYLARDCQLDDVHGWIVRNVQEMDRDPRVSELADTAWLLICELDNGDRTEDSLRAELAALRVAA